MKWYWKMIITAILNGAVMVIGTKMNVEFSATTWLIIVLFIINTFLIYIFREIDKKYDHKRLDDLNNTMRKLNIILNLHENRLTALMKQNPKEMLNVIKEYARVIHEDINSGIEKFQKKSTENPLTNRELQKLRQYFTMVENGEDFALNEAEEFDRLAKEFSNDARNDPSFSVGALVLSALAGFVLAVLLLKK